ncbi:MAG: HPr(Ser) kinase/phosphatase [Candidatus Coatesbacteria bacterium]
MPLTLGTLLEDLEEPLSLRLVSGGAGLERVIKTPDLNRPGLAFSGFLDWFPPDRLQVVGKTEVTFWKTLPAKVRQARIQEVLKLKPVGFIVCHDQEPPRDICAAADAAGISVLASPVPTMKCMSELMLHLEEKLAPSMTVHGSLMDTYGVGVLILGDSGIGKSECALALLNVGHRLVADDVVEIRRTPEKTLLGAGIKALRYHMEIRGLGIVDIQRLFGARAVREHKLVDLVVQLVPWEPGKLYDRTGLEQQTHTILDVALPIHVVPVKTGRNLAVLVEVAAMNFRLKQMGVNPAESLDEAVLREVARDNAPPPRPAAGPSRHKRHEER